MIVWRNKNTGQWVQILSSGRVRYVNDINQATPVVLAPRGEFVEAVHVNVKITIVPPCEGCGSDNVDEECCRQCGLVIQ